MRKALPKQDSSQRGIMKKVIYDLYVKSAVRDGK